MESTILVMQGLVNNRSKMKLLSSVQNVLNQKINQIHYIDNLRYPRSKGNLSKKLNVDYWSMIDPAPLNSETTTYTDLLSVIDKANHRTEDQTTLVYTVDKDPIKLFEALFADYNLDFAYDRFQNLYTYLSLIIKDIKYFYNRARPLQLANFYNLSLDVIHTPTHRTPSYPSGHTAYAALIGCMLSEQYPQYTDEIWSIVKKCAEARILQGVHFHGDNTASIDLVKRVYVPLQTFDQTFSK